MKKANISKIKAELSKFIRYAKQGEEVVIMDRDQPVARLVAITASAQVPIREPLVDLGSILKRGDARSFSETSDIVDVLLSDREDRL